ncbi:MAG: ribosome-associated ATPase/putative transporter RbbA [Janthinobacterium lividum]
MTETGEPVAFLENVWHRYGKQAALRGVSLELRAGGMLGLIGPDGVGKSTLLGILSGAKRVQAGPAGTNRIQVFGGDFTRARHRSAVCARIAYMPQGLGRNLYPDLTVRENIAFFSRLFGQGTAERAQRTDGLLTATGLAPFADRPAGKLSGGMRQKLGLCCALIHDPDLLILDEPTTGVDPLSRRQFWDLVDRIRAARPKMSVIVATAYMEEADRFGQLVAMNDGLVLATGSPAELRQRTGCDTLDESFIALLPAALRAARIRPDIPPLGARAAEDAITAVGLTRRFGSFTAVDDVSFRIGRGEIFGFLGSNGCGKTTTMRMLTGLLPSSAGQALLFGRVVDAADISMRYRVGYMSQVFSLYTELTVRQNLVLHARLYHIESAKAGVRIRELVAAFGLAGHLDTLAAVLPLGIRQRLALAVAVIDEPEILILDEPTSGVDPLARDQFWALLGDLSRKSGVTIFVSTHFMNEAARCDHILLMSAGKVLALGRPAEVIARWGGPTLEEAFIACLEAANGTEAIAAAPAVAAAPRPPHRLFSLQRMLAYSLRETIELRRDPVRLSFALFGMAFLMIVVGYGTNTDVDHLRFAVFDQDQTPESRAYVEAYRGSIYFKEQPPIAGAEQFQQRLTNGELMLVLDIPAGFGRAVRRGSPAAVGAWIDGAMPFRAETTRGYVQGAQSVYLTRLATEQRHDAARATQATDETRFRYNQDFDSVNSQVPSTIALLLALVPAILMALAVVREKEFGSITNLYVTPVTRLEFILGKQIPYVVLAMAGFAVVAVIAWLLFAVPVKGSLLALGVGTLVYVCATTAYGLLISAFASTQIAALFATAMLTVIPATQFSGMLSPVSSLSGTAAVISDVFPMSYYLPIVVGTFTKSLGFAELSRLMLLLALFIPALLVVSLFMLRKQER